MRCPLCAHTTEEKVPISFVAVRERKESTRFNEASRCALLVSGTTHPPILQHGAACIFQLLVPRSYKAHERGTPATTRAMMCLTRTMF